MIDIHCHLLPGLDDGARNLEEGLRMAEIAVLEGIDEIIATPHTYNGVFVNLPDTILKSVQTMQQALDCRSIPVKVHPGAEIYFDYKIIERINTNKIITMGGQGKYLLLELPALHVPLFTDEVLEQLIMKGYIPVLAHPERNQSLRDNPERIVEWIKRGILIQITVDSMWGKWGNQVRAFSKYLVQKELVHFIASDAHSPHGRYINYTNAFHILNSWSKPEAFSRAQNNARRLLKGEDIRGCSIEEGKK